MELLKPSLNMSNKFQSKNLDDPINISINNNLYSKSTTKDIPIRFSSKERIPKEREFIGSYKIPSDYLKKRTNPTEELIKKKEEELRKKKELLELYENTGERFISKNYTTKTDLNGQSKNAQEFTLHELSDLKDYELNNNENEEMAVKEDLIKVIDSQVNLLKKRSQDQIKELSKSNDYNFLKRNKKKFLINGGLLEEPDVDNQYLAINENRVQTLKHVQTKHKPEYLDLDELEKAKSEHEKELMDIEDEYYGRKKLSEEELRRRRELKKKMERQRQLNQMIQRPGYNNDQPLEEKDILYINKFGNYLQNKTEEYNKLGYEEEWNKTRLKSLNSNGLVNRTDGLPGDLDIDDYKLYYYDIDEKNKLNFERPLLIHPHTGKESSYKKTFRNEPGYENTKGKMYHTANNFYTENLGSTNYQTNVNNNYIKNPKNLTINTSNYNNFNNNTYLRQNNAETMKNQSMQFENNNINNNDKNNSYIKMIYKLLPKNSKGKTLKNRIAIEMKLDQNIVEELGFKDEDDFQDKLIRYPTNELNYMNEEEFSNFLINKGIPPNDNDMNENQLYTVQDTYLKDEILPGMSTNTFDFLKNPSTKARLRHVNKVLNGKKSKSSNNLFNHKNKNKNLILDENDFIYYKDRHKYNNKTNPNKLNNSYENNNNINKNSMFKTYTNFNISNNFRNKFNKKSDINFTIPEPFNFLKKNYHEKKLTKIQEILEERQKIEDNIFKNRFHANPYNPQRYNTGGNLNNRQEREKQRREHRLEIKRNEIIANMRPFSFYDKDFENFIKRKEQECIPPKFVPFKANGIRWKSQIKLEQGLKDNELAIKERTKKRALELLNKSKLPPRMEDHEKHRKLLKEEEKRIEKMHQKEEKKKRNFHAKDSPNFKILHEKFIKTLEKKKRLAKPTVPEPFTFHQPKKKAELCNYLDYENDPKNKNAGKNKKYENIKKKLQKKPDIEPATTKALTLLMATRREEIEKRKKIEEDILKENEQRIKKQKDFNEKVRNSEIMIKNKKLKKELEQKFDEKIKFRKEEMKEREIEFKNNMNIVNQRVNNRPLMMENVVREEPVKVMDSQNA